MGTRRYLYLVSIDGGAAGTHLMRGPIYRHGTYTSGGEVLVTQDFAGMPPHGTIDIGVTSNTQQIRGTVNIDPADIGAAPVFADFVNTGFYTAADDFVFLTVPPGVTFTAGALEVFVDLVHL